MTDTTNQRTRLEAFFRRRSDDPDGVKVVDIEPIVGGYSRLMTRVFVEDVAGRRGFIVRSDPPPGQSIINTDRAREWAVLSGLAGSGQISMPAPLWFDASGDELGSPSIVIEMLDADSLVKIGRAADPAEHPAMGRRLAEMAASIHNSDLAAIQHVLEVPASWDDYIDSRIELWADAERAHVDRIPLMRYIAGWLRAHRPPPAPLTLVHGDFQIANVLVTRDDRCAVVDWELAHIGDPREDLGWSAMAGVVQPPDLIRVDEDGFYARYRELTGMTEEQINPAVTDFFLLLSAPTVFVSVIEQLAELVKGETTAISVAYMSPAVIGMSDVFMRAIDHHRAVTGGKP